jgi:hypothetical protein
VRNNAYLFALGPLGLSHEDLWFVTNGQLSDLTEAWEYKQHLERTERAYMTSILVNMWSKRRISAQDIAGVWDRRRGRAVPKEDMVENWKARRRRRKGERDG